MKPGFSMARGASPAPSMATNNVSSRGAGLPASRSNLFKPPSAHAPQSPVSVQMPRGRGGAFSLNPGMRVFAQVAGFKGGSYFLQMGDQLLKARSNVPLEVGKSVQFQVQGQSGGMLQLSLAKGGVGKLNMSSMSNLLTSLNLPASDSNSQLAKAMVENQMPVTRESVQNVSKMVAQSVQGMPANQAPSIGARVAAFGFLQSSGLPVTPQNVLTVAQFLQMDPQVGMQMAHLNTEFKKVLQKGRVDSKTMEMIQGLEKSMTVNSMGGTTKGQGLQQQPGVQGKQLRRFAQQNGIEPNLRPFVDDEEAWDLLQQSRNLRRSMEGRVSASLGKALSGFENNLMTQRLINASRPEGLWGYYYLQLPMRLEKGEYGEAWLQYQQDEQGNPYIDPENFSLELAIATEEMGQLNYHVTVIGGAIHLDVGAPSSEVRAFVREFVPSLQGQLYRLGWQPGGAKVSYTPHQNRRQLVDSQDLEDMESWDVHA